MKIRKAVIPAAGLGTRVLPATKSMPKEMLPIVDRPAIHYIVEEAVRSGITEILIITSRGKFSVEDYFDRSPELEQKLLASGKQQVYEEMLHIAGMANIQYVRQQQPKGLGHAILCAKTFVGNEPFAVLYGDDVIISPEGQEATRELCDAYDKYGKAVVGIKEVTAEAILKYSSLAVSPLEDKIYSVTDMIEKPTADKVLSLYSILGRCVLSPEIFDILEQTQPGAGGEIQLTDAMKVLATTTGMTGVDFTGTRYDMGNKLGVMQAAVEVSLSHPEIGKEFREYLKKLSATL
ncbi:MAG: UTP--glucose-1-phosphate uridylyltransferase GalU [Angelakisella sp.]